MKIFSLKKKTLIIAIIAAVAVAVVITVSVVSATASTVASNGMTVVIDAGHGGIDGGVVGTSTGTKESEVNLGIAKSLKHFLREAGYKVVMTRESDVDLSDGSGSFKQSDMQARKKIIDNAKADMVVSIHQNSYPRKEIKGAQVFYAPNSEVGRNYAESMQTVLNGTLNSDRVAKSGDYYIIQCSETPSILIECGFLSNPTEESLLVTPNYQQKVAYSIMTGIRLILERETIA